MHVVVRATKAKGRLSFLFHGQALEKILLRQATRFGVRLYDVANAGNHLHLLLKVDKMKDLGRFLRASCGLIVRKVSGTERGSPLPEMLRGFFDLRPFSRILSWGKDYNHVKEYLMVNRLEMIGFERMSAKEMLAQIKVLKTSSQLVPLGFG